MFIYKKAPNFVGSALSDGKERCHPMSRGTRGDWRSVAFKSMYALRSNGYTNEEEPKSYTSPTVESNLKPKSNPFVISIGSPESDGKERCPMSSGDRD